MENIILRAHYNGTQILLDDPVDLQPNTKLLITMIQKPETERETWFNFSAQSLDAAYGDDEPEYPVTLIKERNPEYERG
jgi:hypothetical protein